MDRRISELVGEVHVLLMSPHSMGRLLQICTIPTYRQAMRKISFNVATLADADEHEHKYSLRQGKGVSGATSIRRSEHTAHRTYQETYGFSAPRLILETLSMAGIVPDVDTVACALNPADWIRPWGITRLERVLGPQPLDFARADDGFKLVYQAIVRSNILLQRLKLGDCSHRFNPWTIAQTWMNGPRDHQPFRHLKSLGLYLNHNKVVSWRGKIESQEGDIMINRIAIAWLVSQAEQLEDLEIDITNDYYDCSQRRCDAIIFNQLINFRSEEFPMLHNCLKPLQKIRRLLLTGHEISKQSLLDLVHEHRSTLKTLCLWDIINGQRDDPDIEGDLRNASSEESFELVTGRVCEGTRRSLYRGDPGWVPIAWPEL